MILSFAHLLCHVAVGPVAKCCSPSQLTSQLTSQLAYRSPLKKGDRHLAAPSFFEGFVCCSKPVPVFQQADSAVDRTDLETCGGNSGCDSGQAIAGVSLILNFQPPGQTAAGDPQHGIDRAGDAAGGDAGNQPPACQNHTHEGEHSQDDVYPAGQTQMRRDPFLLVLEAGQPLAELPLAQFQGGELVDLGDARAGSGQRLVDRVAGQIVQALGQTLLQLATNFCQAPATSQDRFPPGHGRSKRLGRPRQPPFCCGGDVVRFDPRCRPVGPELLATGFELELAFVGLVLCRVALLSVPGQPAPLFYESLHGGRMPTRERAFGRMQELVPQLAGLCDQTVAALGGSGNRAVDPFQPLDSSLGKVDDFGQPVELVSALADAVPGAPGPFEKHMSTKLLARSRMPGPHIGDLAL